MSIDSILTSKETENSIKKLAKNGTQSILLVGKKGSGLEYVAHELAMRLLGLNDTSELLKYPYYYHLAVEEGKKEIPIAEIRRVIATSTLKIPSKHAGIKRVVLIQNAEKMSLEAQSALLKDLEEPSSSTCYILTQSDGTFLLLTVVSRCQKIVIKYPSLEDVVNHYSKKYEHKEIMSAWSLAGGAPQLVDELLSNDNHPLKTAVAQAKQFIEVDKYHRLLIVNKISIDKNTINLFLEALDRITTHLIRSASVAGDRKKVLNYGKMNQIVGETKQMLESSANTKLCLLWLVTNF